MSAILDSVGLSRVKDSYQRPCLVDKTSGKSVRFEPMQVPGKGWTVAMTVSSLKAGRTSAPVQDFGSSYTLAQAQLAASNLSRDVAQALLERDAKLARAA